MPSSRPSAEGGAIRIRDLHGLSDYQAVVDLEREIWGYTDSADLVTVPVFIITVKRGGILIGAFDEHDRMVGFAFSIVGMKDGRPMQWSHMMGVVPGHRRSGLGRRLKLAQRERALAGGFDLMEWTFDPLQALNAHLNFARLGVIADEYVENLYGESTSALHRGTPTDRLVVQWHLRDARVERRLDGRDAPAREAVEAADLPVVTVTRQDGPWRRLVETNVSAEAPAVLVDVPRGFTEMQRDAPDLALEWRLGTRDLFRACFARGYRAVDFVLGEDGGRYLVARRS